jgi:hypothetical protein
MTTIEDSIKLLKVQGKNYESLSDYDKIMQEDYNDIIEEKEECAFRLNECKKMFENINDDNDDVEQCDDDMFEDIMNKINVIKCNVNDGKGLEDMIDMYANLMKCNKMLKAYCNNKQMEIINI